MFLILSEMEWCNVELVSFGMVEKACNIQRKPPTFNKRADNFSGTRICPDWNLGSERRYDLWRGL